MKTKSIFLGLLLCIKMKNEKGKSEVIDGQQRLTTLMLILRAFYDKFANMQDKNSKLTRKSPQTMTKKSSLSSYVLAK